MPEEVELCVLTQHLAHVRGWAREILISDPRPADPYHNEGCNWKVDISSIVPKPITPITTVLDDIDYFREAHPLVKWR